MMMMMMINKALIQPFYMRLCNGQESKTPKETHSESTRLSDFLIIA